MIGRKQKQRSDAGTVRGSKRSKTTTSTDDNGNTADDQVPAKKKAKPRNKCISTQAQMVQVNHRDEGDEWAGSREEDAEPTATSSSVQLRGL